MTVTRLIDNLTDPPGQVRSRSCQYCSKAQGQVQHMTSMYVPTTAVIISASSPGQQYGGYARGLGLILDNTLNVVKSVQSQGGLNPLDQHEFNVVDNGKSVLITVYQTQQADLSADGVGSGLGWITNCWFQEIALATNKLLFEWSSLDHVSPSYSTIAPNSTDASGTGLDPTLPWDYFHINSVDKDAAGDYLISSRHTSTIYKISGTNGTILWQLSGTNGSTSFSLGAGLNFSYQHDARIRYQNATTTILTLFDKRR